jgi:hypothetical protein
MNLRDTILGRGEDPAQVCKELLAKAEEGEENMRITLGYPMEEQKPHDGGVTPCMKRDPLHE